MRAKFDKGSYYIGALKYILGYEYLSKLKFGFDKFGEYKYANFNVGVHDDGLKDSENFSYCIEDESLGIISADIIDKEILSQKILTLKNSLLANKFSGFVLARVVEFDDEFQISFDEKEIKLGSLCINL